MYILRYEVWCHFRVRDWAHFEVRGQVHFGVRDWIHFEVRGWVHFEVPSTKKLRHQARKKRTSRGWLVNHYAFVFKRILIASHIFGNTFSSLPVTKYDNLARRFFSNRVPQNGTQSRTLKWNPTKYLKMEPNQVPQNGTQPSTQNGTQPSTPKWAPQRT